MSLLNLPTFAVILEDHTLSRVYGASKVVHLINAEINDVNQHINANMSGREISAIYKALGYEEQSKIAEIILFNESETNIIVNQLELLNASMDSQSKMSETLRDLVVLFAATLLVLLAFGILAGYYENARQNNAVIDSKIFAILGDLVEKVSIE